MSTYKSKAKAPKTSLRKLLGTTALTLASLAVCASPAKADGNPWTQWILEHGSLDFTWEQFATFLTLNDDIVIAGSFNLDIPEGYTVNITGGSIFAARALGVDPTLILGAINYDGNLVIIDSNGIFFGENSVVDVGGIVATTGDISNDQIINNPFGAYTIDNIGSNPNARIDMHGTMNIADAGLAAFVAPTVTNSGIINARYGRVGFASGERVTIDPYGDRLFEIEVPGEVAALIENTGTISAEGGMIQMSSEVAEGIVDNLINMEGVVTVASAEMQGGTIILSGNGDIVVDGTLDASGAGGGGEIDVRGENVDVTENGLLMADAIGTGDGGSITMIAQDSMNFDGTASARGGDISGDGGFVEVSGLGSLAMTGFVDTTAANGATGTLLIDPTDLYIDSVWADLISWLLLWNNVDLEATNSITFTENLDFSMAWFFGWHVTGHDLSLTAQIVNILGNVIFGNGNFSINADTLNLDGRLYSRDTAWGATSLMDGSRYTTNANWINVLSNNALIQQAINFAQNGATVNVANDTYTENLTIDKAISLIGNNAILQAAHAGQALINVLAGGVSISSFVFDGAGLTDYGIYASGAGANGLVVDGNTFNNFNEAGIYLANSLGGTSTISNNIFHGSSTRGIVFGALDGNSTVNITDNIFGSWGPGFINALFFNSVGDANVNISGGHMATSGDAIYFANGLGSGSVVNISDVGIEAGLNGINVVGGMVNSILNITGNWISAGQNGINISGGDISGTSINISDNHAIKAEADAIHIEDAVFGGGNNVAINNNSYIWASDDGIELIGLDGGTIQGNEIRYAGDNGIALYNSANFLIGGYGSGQGNEIYNAKNGIRLENTNNTQIVHNYIHDLHGGGTDGDGIMLYNGQNVLIDGNTIENVGDEGIFVTGSVDGLRILNNMISHTGLNTGGSGNGIELLNTSGYALIDGNMISDAGYYGIWIKNPNADSSFDITNNVVMNSDIGGIRVDGNALNVSYNLVEGFSTNGIHIFNSNGVNVVGNDVGIGDGMGIAVENSDDANIEDNAIYGVDQHGIYVANSNNVDIVNNRMKFLGWDGIHVDGGVNALISGNYIYDTGFSGIYVNGNAGVQITDNDLEEIGGNGINVENSNNAYIAFNNIFNAGGHGIFLSGSAFADIIDNDVLWASGDGVHLLNSDSAMIAGNTIDNSGLSGIWLNNSNGSIISSNEIRGTGRHGIYVLNSDNVEISSNDMKHLGWDGIHVEGGSGVLIRNNDIYDAGFDGIDVNGNTGLVMVDGNYIRDVGDSGVEVENSAEVIINNNDIAHTGGDGIQGWNNGNGMIISNNLIDDAGDDGIDVQGSRQARIDGNTVHNVVHNGIEVSDDSDGTRVRDNIISDIGGNGVDVQDSRNVRVNDNFIDRTGGHGIYFFNAHNARANRNNLDDIGGDAIRILESTGNIQVRDNLIGTEGHIGGYGVYVETADGNRGNSLTITGNTINDTGSSGVYAENYDTMDVNNNTITNVGGYGLEIYRFMNATVTGNTVNVAGMGGIFADGYNDDGLGLSILVSDNTVSNVEGNGVEVGYTDTQDIMDNTVSNAGGYGIYSYNAALSTISGNTVSNSFDDGIRVEDSAGTVIVDNVLNDIGFLGGNVNTDASGIFVSNVAGVNGGSGIGSFDPADLHVLISGNQVNNSAGNGISIDGSGNTEVTGNTVDAAGAIGLLVSNNVDGSVVDIDNNDLTNNDVGISLVDTNDVIVQNNILTDNLTTGIEISGSNGVDILFNDITGSQTGLLASGTGNGAITLVGNVFTNNDVGARFESGQIDISDLVNPNTFNGGGTALEFDGPTVSIVGNTLGGTIFSGQSNFYVALSNGALFNPGTPTIIDGSNANFDGFVLADQPLDIFGNNVLTAAQLAAIEAKLFDFDDLGSIGQIFVGLLPNNSNIEDFFSNFGNVDFGASGFDLTVLGLPSVGALNAAATLNQITPAAGGDEEASDEDVASIEPAAGGEDTVCLSEAIAGASAGSPFTYSFGGAFEDSISDVATCGGVQNF